MGEVRVFDKRGRIEEWARSRDIDLVLLAGLDGALIGVVTKRGGAMAVCYDTTRIIDILQKRDGLSYEEAVEWYSVNIEALYVGEHTPVFLLRPEEMEE